MRKLYLLSILSVALFSGKNCLAQGSDDCYKRKYPLNIFAFRKMMREQYNYAILGTQTPTSGFKVETNKPTITLKGNIFSSSSSSSKTLLVNLEVTGGVQDDLAQIFSGNQLNGFFKASLGFNMWLKKLNSANFGSEPLLTQLATHKTICQYREEIQKQIDTFLVLQAIESHIPDKSTTLDRIVSYIVTNAADGKNKIDGYTRAFTQEPDSIRKTDSVYRSLLLAMIRKYGADSSLHPDDLMYKKFIDTINVNGNNNLKNGKLLSDIKTYLKFKDRTIKYDLLNDFEIATYKDIWQSKQISWMNISISGINSSFKLYNATDNTLTNATSLLPSLTVAYNFFKKWKPANKYAYFRAGIVIKRTNSLIDLTKFDYKKETVIVASPTEQLKSEKSGTAYVGELTHGIGIEVPFEFYCSPWDPPAIPGLYAKLQYSYGQPWINKNKISFDLGILWNVSNSDKDSKNLLTIVPYMSWSNVLKEYKDVSKVQAKKASDVFSVNIKFGIPVNLGK